MIAALVVGLIVFVLAGIAGLMWLAADEARPVPGPEVAHIEVTGGRWNPRAGAHQDLTVVTTRPSVSQPAGPGRPARWARAAVAWLRRQVRLPRLRLPKLPTLRLPKLPIPVLPLELSRRTEPPVGALVVDDAEFGATLLPAGALDAVPDPEPALEPVPDDWRESTGAYWGFAGHLADALDDEGVRR